MAMQCAPHCTVSVIMPTAGRPEFVEHQLTRIAAQEAVAALMEGYLVKQPLHGHALSRPRRRYFVLTEDCLEWFSDDKSRHQPPRDRLKVKGAIVQRQGDTLTLHTSHLDDAPAAGGLRVGRGVALEWAAEGARRLDRWPVLLPVGAEREAQEGMRVAGNRRAAGLGRV